MSDNNFMKYVCVVPGCQSKHRSSIKKGTQKKSFFTFPMDDPELLENWVSKIPRDFSEFKILKYVTKICEDHFEPSCIKRKAPGKFARLVKGSVPTIFDVPLKKKGKQGKLPMIRKKRNPESSDSCRFCLQKFNGVRISIDDEIRNKFQLITDMELKADSIYSSKICSFCNRNLEFVLKFRSKLIKQQTALYESLRIFEKPEEEIEAENQVPEIEIKEEEPDKVDESVSGSKDLEEEVKEEPDSEMYFEEPSIIEDENQIESLNFVTVNDDAANGLAEEDEAGNDNDDDYFKQFFDKSKKSEIVPEYRVNMWKNKEFLKSKRICPECGRTLTIYTLQRHIKRMHGSKQRFQCDLCRFSSKEKHELNVHMRIHLNIFDFPCTICSKKFHTGILLRQHIKNFHGKKKREPLTCEVCGKQFLTPHSYKGHIQQVHMGILKYQCSYPNCSEKFMSKETKLVHEESVHMNRVFKCKDCDGKEFKSEIQYKKHHKVVHNKTFECHICFMKFSHKKTGLDHHIKTVHQGIMEFECHLCNRNFARKCALKFHLVEFHMNVKIPCPLPNCKTQHSNKTNLRKHFLTKHFDLDEDSKAKMLEIIKMTHIEFDETKVVR